MPSRSQHVRCQDWDSLGWLKAGDSLVLLDYPSKYVYLDDMQCLWKGTLVAKGIASHAFRKIEIIHCQDLQLALFKTAEIHL